MRVGKNAWWILTIIVVALATAWVVFRPDRLARVASGVAAHTLCSSVFISRQDPERTFDEHVRTVVGGAAVALGYRVLHAPRGIEASFLGGFGATAIYQDGYGCRLEHPDNTPLPQTLGTLAPAAVAAVSTEAGPNPALARAIDQVFQEDPAQLAKRVQAVVIMKDGRVVAERYAPGVDATTPLLSYSVAKSFTNALLGILVRQGRLSVGQVANAPEWKEAGDARKQITVEDLIRMQSGLDAGETGTGRDPVSQMEFVEADMAAFAAARPVKAVPGTAWDYTSANTLVLTRLMQKSLKLDAAGFRLFAHRELFSPAQMGEVVMGVDGVGHFVGSTYLYATARDYAKFGELYRNDGVAPNGRRILPKGWVAWSMQSTLGTSYGAGWWTNQGKDDWTQSRIEAGFSEDGFFASGFLGQRIYVIPSEGLVIARFGYSAPPDFGMAGDLALIRTAIEVLQ